MFFKDERSAGAWHLRGATDILVILMNLTIASAAAVSVQVTCSGVIVKSVTPGNLSLGAISTTVSVVTGSPDQCWLPRAAS